MLKVTVEIIPFGDLEQKSTIAEITIWNDGTGTSEKGNYQYTAHHNEYAFSGHIKGFKRTLGALALIGRVIKQIERG